MNIWLNIFFLLGAVVIGGLLVTFLERSNRQQIIKLSLAFSGGFLLSIAFVHFLPELYHDHKTGIGIWVLGGFLVQLLLEYMSGGIEHGHVHVHAPRKIPYMLLLSLSVHSFIEGIPLADIGHHVDSHPGDHHESLLVGIVLHQLPVAIALMTLLRLTQLSSQRSWLILMIFGLMTPLGLLTGTFGVRVASDYMDYLLALVVGMFLHISTTIIFETNENHKFNLAKLLAILLGAALTFFM